MKDKQPSEINIRIKTRPSKVVEVPYIFSDRAKGTSKIESR